MTHRPETKAPITVMTSRDARLIFGVLRDAANGSRRQMPAGVGDEDDLLALMRGGVAFLLAYQGTMPVGAVAYRWERTSLRLVHVAVLPACQRRGVAARLVQAVESIGFALGGTNVSVEFGPDAAPSFPFERFGYASSRAEAPREGLRTGTTIRKAIGERL